jgi:RNA polymerase sigma-70 factor (ECF subfamily)
MPAAAPALECCLSSETGRRAGFAPAPSSRDGAAAVTTDTGRELDEGEVASALVRRIAAGDTAAEAQLVARYSRGIHYLLRRLGAAPELADDLHQETFRIVLERLRRSGLAEPAGLVGFLRGTARNLVQAERRKAFRRRTDGLDPLDLAAAEDPAPSQLQAVLYDEQAALVRRLVGELATDRDRQILLRFYVGEEDKGRICADLGLDSLHFNRVLFRARQRFKQLVERCQKGA